MPDRPTTRSTPATRFHGLLVRPAEPLVVLREEARRELGNQHGARLAQPDDDLGVFVDDAVLEVGRAPGRRDAPRGEQVLEAVRQAVQRSTVLPSRDLGDRRAAASAIACVSRIVTAQLSVGLSRVRRSRYSLVRCVDVTRRARSSAARRCAGRNTRSSGDAGTAPFHASGISGVRANAAAPRSRTSRSSSAPVPPGYGWNWLAGGSALPSGQGSGAGAWAEVLPATGAWACRAPGVPK